MKPAMLTGVLFVALSYVATAQKFSLLPQLGIENSRTILKYNNGSALSPLGVVTAPKFGARLEYQARNRQGAFVGISTNRSVVSLESSDPASGIASFKSTAGNLRPQLEAGYQLSTKRIYLGKSHATTGRLQPAAKTSRIAGVYNHSSNRCGGSTVRNHCGRSSAIAKASQGQSKNNSWFVTIKPSVGAAFVPGVQNDLSAKTATGSTSYTYNAGNWTTALTTGAAFEFGNRNQRKFTLAINYLKGIGNMGSRSITTTASEGKMMVTQFSSGVSNWNLTAGIPISLGKTKKPLLRQKPEHHSNDSQKRCGQYKMYRKFI